MTSERLVERQESVDAPSLKDKEFKMDEVDEYAPKSEEQGKDTAKEETESWRDEVSHSNTLPAALSSPEAAPSVTPDRKNELLLQARADRVSWIQKVPLPYEAMRRSTDDDNPWNHDDRLLLLKDSNAVQSLPCIPQVLTSLYGMDQGTSAEVADRIQTVVSFTCSCFVFSRDAHVL